MSGPGDMDPGFLAQIDRERAASEHEVRKIAEAFRAHADEAHDGDPICSHALCAFGLSTRHPMVIADIAASAIGVILKLDAVIADLEANVPVREFVDHDGNRWQWCGGEPGSWKWRMTARAGQ